MIRIIETGAEWRETLALFDNYDFYHTHSYHCISKNEDEAPFLVVYEEVDVIIAIPFLKRPIEGTEYFDLTSVYGYVGPISRNIDAQFDNSRFISELGETLKDHSIISVFSRLHPFVGSQDVVLRGIGTTPIVGVVVNIDLMLGLATQRAQYGKSTKYRTNQCRRLCRIEKVETQEDINTFIDIYYDNMDRLSATNNYYFSREYFFDLLKSDEFKIDVLLVIQNESNEAIAGAMFVKTNKIVQFHLSGTSTGSSKLAPANLFVDEMRINATTEGYEVFNLGGGLGGKQDSLFDFKSSFSRETREFRIWKWVLDREVYQLLSAGKVKDGNDEFLPLYRRC